VYRVFSSVAGTFEAGGTLDFKCIIKGWIRELTEAKNKGIVAVVTLLIGAALAVAIAMVTQRLSLATVGPL
jgi:hypothetical protein